MRSRRTCLLTMLLSVFFTLSFAVQLMAADTLTVGVPVDRCPIFYVDNGEIVGIGVDLMRAVCEEAGYVASFREIEEETLKDALDNEEYDLLMPFGSAITSASGKLSIVTENLIQTAQVAFIHRDTFSHLFVGFIPLAQVEHRSTMIP